MPLSSLYYLDVYGFVMCLLLVLPLPRLFLLQPLKVLMRQTRQAVRAINQSIFLRCLWVCYVPATSAASSKAFLLQPLTVLMRQTRKAIHIINQSIFLRCLWVCYVTSAASSWAFFAAAIKTSNETNKAGGTCIDI